MVVKMVGSVKLRHLVIFTGSWL